MEMEQQAKKLAELLKALANEYRLQILCYLIEKPQTVGALSEKISRITQPAISQHLSLLKAHDIINSEKTAQSVTYFIADERIREVIKTLKEHYC